MPLPAPFEHPWYEPALRVANILRETDNIVVTAHANPDGDAAGATVALGLGLTALGKRVALCNATRFPEYLSWLPWQEQIYQRMAHVPFTPALVVVLDCGDATRLGREVEEEVRHLPTITMDHHLGNPGFGTVDNWVEPGMAATGQMAAAVLAALGVPLQGGMAEAVYVALTTDTGGFSFDNTTADVLDLAAHLVRQGLDIASVQRRLDHQWSLERMRVWGRLIQSFTMHCGGRVACIVVPIRGRMACKAMGENLEGIVEHLRRLRGVEVAVLVRENEPKRCKISLRSSGPVDVRAIVAVFGGGGHRNAAGALLKMPLKKAVSATLKAVAAALECA